DDGGMKRFQVPGSRFQVLVLVAAASAIVAGTLQGAGPAGPVDFVAHDIDANFRGGYSVSVADFNKDGKPDVLANSLAVSELAWYENPTWERHVIVSQTQQIVNEAIADIDGDGIPEIAFQSSFAMQAANSAGLNWIAPSTGGPPQPRNTEQTEQL